MEFIIEYRPLAEFVYFLSWPVALIAASIGIYQIKNFRKEAQVRFRRETVSITLEILDRKIKSLINLSHNALQRDISDAPAFEHRFEGFNKEQIHCNPQWLQWYESDESLDFRNDVIDTLNEFDTLANYIYSGILDEDLCYSLESDYILHQLETFKPYIALLIQDKNSRLYANLVKLYCNWTDRFLHDKTKKEHDKLSKTLAEKPKPPTQKIIDFK